MGLSYDDFRDRHVIVTGAGAGIGRATALAFAAQGARVTAIDIDAAGLRATADAVPDAAPGIATAPCDLADPAALEATFRAALDRDGAVRCLVNNAGVDRRIAFADMTPDDWRWMLAVNLDHQMLAARLVAPRMDLSDGHAAIVNMTSSAWMKLAGNLAAYHAAKAGIVGLTRGLARDPSRRSPCSSRGPGRLAGAQRGLLSFVCDAFACDEDAKRVFFLLPSARGHRRPALAVRSTPPSGCSLRRRPAPAPTDLSWRRLH